MSTLMNRVDIIKIILKKKFNIIHDEDITGISAYKIAKILNYNETIKLFDIFLKNDIYFDSSNISSFFLDFLNFDFLFLFEKI